MNDFVDVNLEQPPMPSAFRMYCHEKWYEHKDEIFSWTGSTVEYDASYYFNKHRWMLRAMYRNEINNA